MLSILKIKNRCFTFSFRESVESLNTVSELLRLLEGAGLQLFFTAVISPTLNRTYFQDLQGFLSSLQQRHTK